VREERERERKGKEREVSESRTNFFAQSEFRRNAISALLPLTLAREVFITFRAVSHGR